MKPWIVYVRVSTDEQAAQGASLDAQEKACRTLLDLHGHGPVELVRDDVSGKDLKRPGIGAVVRRMEAGEITGLCVYAIDRLTRRARDLDDLVELFEAKHIELISVRERVDTSGPHGRFVLRLMGSIAQLERETIASRVRMGMAHRKAQGGYLGRAPAGTVAIRGPDQLRRLHQHPEHGPLVARIWPMLIEGRSLMDCARYLDGAGVKTSKRTRWSRVAVRWLVSSPNVVGVLVERATWQKAQAAVTARHRKARDLEERPTPGRTDREYPLAGLCFCAGCRSAMVIGSSTGRGGKAYPYLKCSGRKRYGSSFCDARDLAYDAVEAAIIEGMGHRVADGSFGAAWSEWIAKRHAAAEASVGRGVELRAERDRLAQGIERLADLVAAGDAAGRAVSPRLADMQRALEGVEGEISGIDAGAAMLARDEAAIARLIADVGRGVERLGAASVGDRAAVFAGMVDRIDLRRDDAEIALAVPGGAHAAQVRYSQLNVRRTTVSPVVRIGFDWRRVGQGLTATAR